MKKGLKRFLSTMLAASVFFSAAYISAADSTPLTLLTSSTAYAAESQIGITDAQGWLETAWVEWNPSDTNGVSYYGVSYSANGSAYTAIDNELIRMYADGHWRADLVGLKAGTYTVKVEAFNSSGSSAASETASVTVSAHNRTGFTFSSESRTYDSSDPLQCGGYNGDGTPKSNADIIYITSADDIDNVTYEGYTGLSTILQNRHKQSGNPLIVRIIGKIEYSGDELNSSGYIQVKPAKDYYDISTTIEGIGSDTTINFGILARNAGNVEIRNLAIHDFKDDGISLDTSNTNIWIHNNEIFYGVQGSGDKAKGDGSTDIKNDSQYVTISYNHYWDGGKVSLCGMKSESGDNYITYHHNWFDHSDSRHPRIRTMFVHIYNNYYDGNAKYGVGASADSNAFVEGNYFRNCKDPTLQGSVGVDNDGSGDSNTFDDSPAIGAIKMWNNYITGANSDWGMDSSSTSSGSRDAYNASARDEAISYTTAAGSTYRNVDVSNAYIQSLASSIEEPEAAKTNVEKYAGRVGGGDFASAAGFEFTDSSDDTSSDINSTLRTAITNYYTDSLSSNYTIASIGGSVDGSIVITTTESTTESTTDATEETTETTTETTTYSTPVELGEAVTSASSGSISVTYNASTDKWTLTDASEDEAAEISIPFAEQTSGKIVISGTVEPSTTASKWMFLQIWGTNAAGASSEILAFGGGSTKGDLSYRINDGGSNYVKIGTAEAAEYSYTVIIDLDAKTADLTVGSVNVAVTGLDVSSLTSVNSITSKTGERNIILSVPYVGVLSDEPSEDTDYLIGDADADGVYLAADAANILQKVLDNSYVTPIESKYPSVSYIDLLDVENDGGVTASDAANVLQKVLDADYAMPCEK